MSSSKKVVKKSKKTVVKKQTKKIIPLTEWGKNNPQSVKNAIAAYEHANELDIPELETSTVPPTLADEKLYEDQCQIESIKNPNLYWKGVMDLAGLELAIVALVLMLIWVYSVTWR